MTRWRFSAPLLWAFAVVVALPAPSAADGPVTVEVLKRITSVSPFPGPCGRDSLLVTINAEVEPYIAVKPGHPNRMAVAFIQDSGRSNIVLSTGNGGRTWGRAFVPGLSECTGGRRPNAVDPWLSFGPDGSLYLGSAVATAYPFSDPDSDPVAGIVVSRSRTAGRSWNRARFAQRPEGNPPGLFWDKPALTADPSHPGSVYVVFDQNSQDGTAIGSSFSATSRDGGRTWSRRSRMFDPQTTEQWPAVNIPLVLPGGTLVDIGLLYGIDAERVEFFAQRSRDGGSTWSPPVTIGTAPNRQPTSPAGVEASALEIPAAAVAENGDLYVVWTHLGAGGSSAVRISRSVNGGRSWSRPEEVAHLGGQAFLPQVAVAGDGTVGVLYYGTQRDRPATPAWTTDVYLSRSTDGGRSWRQRRVAGPFDMNTAERAGGELFVGDYVGLAGLPHGFAAAFPMAHPEAKVGPSDVFFARIGTGG